MPGADTSLHNGIMVGLLGMLRFPLSSGLGLQFKTDVLYPRLEREEERERRRGEITPPDSCSDGLSTGLVYVLVSLLTS